MLTLPTPRPTLPTYNPGRTLDEIATQWDTARFGFALTPTPTLDLTIDYAWTHKHGDYPVGVAFGSPGGNFLEVAAPVDQHVHDFRTEGSWVGDGWQIQAGYLLSIFQNDESSLTVDNPCFGLAGATADPVRDRRERSASARSSVDGAGQHGQHALPGRRSQCAVLEDPDLGQRRVQPPDPERDIPPSYRSIRRWSLRL